MDRRGFVQALLPVFMVPWLKQNSEPQDGTKLAPIGPGKYILFADPQAVDIDAIAQTPCMEGVEMELITVQPRGDQTITDCVLLYKLDNQDSDS